MNIVVILGLRLNDDGSMKQELVDRLDLGIETYKTNDASKIYVTGGIANRKAKTSEASKMYDYLISKDIDKDILFKEEKSKTTYGNAKFLYKMLKNENIEKIYLVSTKYHFFRTNFPQAHVIFQNRFKNIEIVKVYKEQ